MKQVCCWLLFLRASWFLLAASAVVAPLVVHAAATTDDVTVYASMPAGKEKSNDIAVARKQRYDLEQRGWTVQYLTVQQQRSFLESHCPSAVPVYDAWGGNDSAAGTAATADDDSSSSMANLQTELFKWCALSTSTSATAIFLDSSSPILSLPQSIIRKNTNIAVLDDDDGDETATSLDKKKQQKSSSSSKAAMIHGSYIQIANNTGGKSVARKMLQILLDYATNNKTDLLRAHALFVPQTLYNLITETSSNSEQWDFWHLKCRRRRRRTSKDQPLQSTQNNHHPHMCPVDAGYCCAIQDRTASVTVMLSRHYILPLQNIPGIRVASGDNDDDDDNVVVADGAFVSTVTVKENAKTTTTTTTSSINNNEEAGTPNFYDILKEQDCLPDDDDCSKCLREKKGASCEQCADACGCYCEMLCRDVDDVPAKKRVAQEWTVTPPHYSNDPTRLVPRIVHQTWFEELNDATKYPNMSRLVESFKQTGWDYRFYSDDDAVVFLETHFPPAVLEAYQALKPGAFKADLFRYCVLLISGGVYADVDIQLESALDISIPPDVGFMVPVDEPGKPVQKQMCLWNGFIASAPAHPILAKAIETVVNQVRNRFTSVDIDATFCPDPELSVLHAYDTLFTAGPCLLGSSLNRVLGRNGQTSHVPGELKDLWSGQQRELTKEGTSFVLGVDEEGGFPLEHRIPGRTVILHQNKWDMGAHRFTFLEQNLVVAATDLPDSNDRENLDDTNGGATEHYSKTHAKTGIYGVEHLYVDQEQANEDIRIFIDASMHAKKQMKAVADY